MSEARRETGRPALDALELLEKVGALSPTSIELVRRFAATWNLSLVHAILECHVLGETDLADELARALKIDRVFHCRTLPIAQGALKTIPFRQAKEWEVLPVGVTQDSRGRFEVVLADPTDTARLEALTRQIGRELSLAVAERSDIVRAIDELYALEDQLPGLFGKPG